MQQADADSSALSGLPVPQGGCACIQGLSPPAVLCTCVDTLGFGTACKLLILNLEFCGEKWALTCIQA